MAVRAAFTCTSRSGSCRHRWSRAVLDALREEHPEVLAEAVAEPEAVA